MRKLLEKLKKLELDEVFKKTIIIIIICMFILLFPFFLAISANLYDEYVSAKYLKGVKTLEGFENFYWNNRSDFFRIYNAIEKKRSDVKDDAKFVVYEKEKRDEKDEETYSCEDFEICSSFKKLEIKRINIFQEDYEFVKGYSSGSLYKVVISEKKLDLLNCQSCVYKYKELEKDPYVYVVIEKSD